MLVVSELVASGVLEHVRMNLEWELYGFSGPGDRFRESCGRGWATALADEDISGIQILPA